MPSRRTNVAVIVIKADGTQTKTVQPRQPDLAALQKYVGGYIERVPRFTRFTFGDREYVRGTLYADEEGKLRGKAMNAAATEAWAGQPDMPGHTFGDRLVGDVVYVAPTGETCDG